MKYFSEVIEKLKQDLGLVNPHKDVDSGRVQHSSSDALLLSGPLGIGKTTFVQELIESLGGMASEVKSPTFLTLIEHEVPGFGRCMHLDCYRLKEPAELDRLGVEDRSDARLWLVEWPDLFLQWLRERPMVSANLGIDQFYRLEFSQGENDRSRRVVLSRL